MLVSVFVLAAVADAIAFAAVRWLGSVQRALRPSGLLLATAVRLGALRRALVRRASRGRA